MEIAIKNNQRLIKANYRSIERVLNKALTHLAYKGRHTLISGKHILEHLEISVLFVNDAGMRRLNHLYRGIDRTTDVLSFPLNNPTRTPLNLKGVRVGLLLGDIVISLPQAKRQAQEYRTAFNRELARLLIHGLLHLLGYDHEKSSYRAAKMRRLEAELAEVVCR
jgi:probable rRNA maturation factor